MKKESRKISYDNIWAIEQIRKKKDLSSFDETIRFLINYYNKVKN